MKASTPAGPSEALHHPVEIRTFPEQPDVLDLGHREKVLHSPYRTEWREESEWGPYYSRLTVPAGFAYNGASVPQFLWSIYPPHALDRAAVFHDFIYRTKGMLPDGAYQYKYLSMDRWENFPDDTKWERDVADKLFYHHLSQDPKGPNVFRRRAAWLAVRAFGGSRWG